MICTANPICILKMTCFVLFLQQFDSKMASIDGSKSVFESSDDGSTFVSCVALVTMKVRRKKPSSIVLSAKITYVIPANLLIRRCQHPGIIKSSLEVQFLESRRTNRMKELKARSSANVVGKILQFTARIIITLCALTAKH